MSISRRDFFRQLGGRKTLRAVAQFAGPLGSLAGIARVTHLSADEAAFELAREKRRSVPASGTPAEPSAKAPPAGTGS